MKGIYLLLGSNLGDRKHQLAFAKKEINRFCTIQQASSFYSSKAWGLTSQPHFLNQVIKISSSRSPKSLLALFKSIEAKGGRIKWQHWGTRRLDIDIVYYGKGVFASKKLVVPHPQIANRRFTLAPLNEIAPNEIHPRLKRSNRQIYIRCKDRLPVQKLQS